MLVSSSGYGRFDLAAPNDTCYTAETGQLTLLETWAGMRVVPSTELVDRAISRIQPATDRNLADLTSNAAAQFGVTDRPDLTTALRHDTGITVLPVPPSL